MKVFLTKQSKNPSLYKKWILIMLERTSTVRYLESYGRKISDIVRTKSEGNIPMKETHVGT